MIGLLLLALLELPLLLHLQGSQLALVLAHGLVAGAWFVAFAAAAAVAADVDLAGGFAAVVAVVLYPGLVRG